MQRTLWLILAIAGLAGSAWLVFGGGSPERPLDDGPLAATEPRGSDVPATPRVATEQDHAEEEVERRELELAEEMGLVESQDFEARARLTLRGRVVDATGSPIAGAVVEPNVRRSARAMFERGAATRDPGMDWRALFRARPLAKAIRTTTDGRFSFSGPAFGRGSSLELSIQHEGFAPAIMMREWTAEDGDVVLEDVVLAAGATVTGVVVGPTTAPVPAARVTFAQRNDSRRRGGRGFGGDDRLGELVGEVETDAAGRFVLEHVPAGKFRLAASARRHVDGRSGDAEARDGVNLDVGEIKLGPGAILSGVVIDPIGAPVVDAEVTATLSRNRQAAARNDERGRNLREVFAAFGGARQSTRTDSEGRFELDRVPQAPLRVQVRHRKFVDENVDPIDPVVQSEMRVRLRESPAATGVVVEARTGEPVELFGIRARPAPRSGLGRAGTAQLISRFANSNPEGAARFADAQTRQQQEEAWRRQRVGGSGLVPGRAPQPSAHPQGQFRLDDLQPGDYVFDVDAPGYVRLAAGVFSISADAANDGLVIQVERGFALAGRIVDSHTAEPVEGARIALAIPPMEHTTPDPMAALRGVTRMGGGRSSGGRDRLDEARTGPDGRFELRPMRAGTFLLTVDAADYPGFRDAAYPLGPSSGNVELQLDPGARVWGVVAGLERGGRAELEFSHAQSGTTRRTDIDPADGSYRIQGLVAGGWFVRVIEGGDQRRGDFRSRIGNAVAARSGAAPDLVVPAGADLRFDIAAASLELAKVRGRVFRNGQPADGLQVRMLSQPSNAGADPQLDRMVRGRLGQFWNSRIDAGDGSFEIASVPPGDYRLEVLRAGGRGAVQGGVLHSEPLSVRKGQVAERVIGISIGAVDIEVLQHNGEQVARARVTLVLAAEAGDTDPRAWGRLPSLQRLTVRDGRATSRYVPPGAWRFAVEARGFKTQAGEISVGAIDAPARAAVRLEANPDGGD